jgi:hypothetical protein
MASSVAVRGAPAIRPLRITALSEQSGGAGLPVRDRLGFGHQPRVFLAFTRQGATRAGDNRGKKITRSDWSDNASTGRVTYGSLCQVRSGRGCRAARPR